VLFQNSITEFSVNQSHFWDVASPYVPW
jgi:hypothetical protein